MEPREFGEWVERIGGGQEESDLLAGRKQYQALSGQIFQDDKSYESRMGLFFEWFTLDRVFPETGNTPLQQFLLVAQSTGDAPTPEIVRVLSSTLHGIFQVTQARSGELRIREMFEDKEFRVKDDGTGLYFNKQDVFEGRLIQMENANFLTGNYVYHPTAAVKFIRSKIKLIQVKEKEDFKTLRTYEKELEVIQKNQMKNDKAVLKLVAKIEKTKKPEKRDVLEQEKLTLENNGHRIRGELEKATRQVENYKSIELGTNLRQRRFDLIQQLSYMSLKWERSRQIALTDIYKD